MKLLPYYFEGVSTTSLSKSQVIFQGFSTSLVNQLLKEWLYILHHEVKIFATKNCFFFPSFWPQIGSIRRWFKELIICCHCQTKIVCQTRITYLPNKTSVCQTKWVFAKLFAFLWQIVWHSTWLLQTICQTIWSFFSGKVGSLFEALGLLRREAGSLPTVSPPYDTVYDVFD